VNYIERFINRRKTWINSRSIPNKCLILLYHRVGAVNKRLDPYSLTVSPENFSEHLRILKNYNVISLSELIKRINDKNLNNNYVVITFDDGYADNLYIVKPLLEKFNIPATFFLTSGYSGKYFWWDKLAAFLEFFPNKKREFIDYIYDILKHLSYNEKQNFINQIFLLSFSTDSKGLMKCMSKDEIISFASSSLIEIGGHTVNHFPLGTLEKQYQKQEILKNKEDLENLLQKEINLFSYPNGNYNNDTINILKENSFVCGLTGSLGINSSSSDIFLLNRFSVRNWNQYSFKWFLKHWL